MDMKLGLGQSFLINHAMDSLSFKLCNLWEITLY